MFTLWVIFVGLLSLYLNQLCPSPFVSSILHFLQLNDASLYLTQSYPFSLKSPVSFELHLLQHLLNLKQFPSLWLSQLKSLSPLSFQHFIHLFSISSQLTCLTLATVYSALSHLELLQSLSYALLVYVLGVNLDEEHI